MHCVFPGRYVIWQINTKPWCLSMSRMRQDSLARQDGMFIKSLCQVTIILSIFIPMFPWRIQGGCTRCTPYISLNPVLFTIHTYMHAYIHTYMHACIHAYMHTCIHAYMNTCIHTCLHAYTHAYIGYIFMYAKATFISRPIYNT